MSQSVKEKRIRKERKKTSSGLFYKSIKAERQQADCCRASIENQNNKKLLGLFFFFRSIRSKRPAARQKPKEAQLIYQNNKSPKIPEASRALSALTRSAVPRLPPSDGDQSRYTEPEETHAERPLTRCLRVLPSSVGDDVNLLRKDSSQKPGRRNRWGASTWPLSRSHTGRSLMINGLEKTAEQLHSVQKLGK